MDAKEIDWIGEVNQLLEGHPIDEVLTLAVALISFIIDHKYRNDQFNRKRLRLALDLLYDSIVQDEPESRLQ